MAFDIAAWIFGSRNRGSDRDFSRIIDSAIDKTVEVTDPRIRAIYGYRKQLRPAVETAVRYVIDVGNALPAPHEIEPNQFSTDPQARAYFASANDFLKAICSDDTIADAVRNGVALGRPRLFFGLTMTLDRKRVFAPAMRDGVLLKEVARTSVSFRDPNFLAPSDTESGLRRDIKERAFVALLECGLKLLSDKQDAKQTLHKQRVMLKTKLRHLQDRQLGLGPASGSGGSLVNVQRDLDRVQRELVAAATNKESLGGSIKIISEVLSNPEVHLQVHDSGIRLTQMNYEASPQDDEPAEDVIFSDVTASIGVRRICRLFTYPRANIAAGMRSSKAVV